MKTPRATFRWIRRRWRLAASLLIATLGLGYTGVCVATTLAVSPADRFLSLADGRMLAYTATGADDASVRVLLIHGAPADASSWRRFLDAHADAFEDVEFLAVDRLGYGRSDGAIETSLEAHARSLAPLLTGRTILVGHSYGGPVALATAAMFPDRVSGLVLVAGATDPGMHDAQGFRRFIDALSPFVPQAWSAANLELLSLTAENDALAALLGQVSCPVVAVHGTWDPVCPHDGTTAHLHSALPNAQSVTIDSIARAGHNLHLTHHDHVATAIRSMIDVAPAP